MRLLKRLIASAIDKAGYRIHAKSVVTSPDPDSMESALLRLQRIGVNPKMIIDVGAAQGIWTKKAMDVWASAQYELVEPLIEQKVHLDRLKDIYKNVDYHMAVAGDKTGTINLNIAEDLDGSGIYGAGVGNARQVPVITIDSIINKTSPCLVKLDTHGYEKIILEGAVDSYKFISVLIIEVYGFHISPTCLTFHELTDYLDSLGFRLFDIVEVMRRPADNAFWQADAVYLPKDHPVFLSIAYA